MKKTVWWATVTLRCISSLITLFCLIGVINLLVDRPPTPQLAPAPIVDDTALRLRASIGTNDVEPDDHAKALAYAKVLQLPVEAIQDDLEWAEKRILRNKYNIESLQETAPGIAKWLTAPKPKSESELLSEIENSPERIQYRLELRQASLWKETVEAVVSITSTSIIFTIIFWTPLTPMIVGWIFRSKKPNWIWYHSRIAILSMLGTVVLAAWSVFSPDDFKLIPILIGWIALCGAALLVRSSQESE
jgi:hypothetical protein